MAAAIKNVTVIGGGLMGSGIAQVNKTFFLGLFLSPFVVIFSSKFLAKN
jgi:hypothetical protein